jgi:uncharacterized coiled-coil DUF342 family protein
MSIFTLLALIVLPILGGFIAWAGDIIGYRLGKSRRSLLGLRPRSTARFIAVVVGVVLPLVTMIVAAAGSENVRTALFRLTELTQQRAQLEEKNTQLVASAESSRLQKENAQKQYDEARRRLATAHADLKAADDSLRTTRSELSLARAERQRLAGQVAELQATREGLQADLSRAQQSLTTTAEALATTQTALRQAERDEEAAKARLAAADEKIVQLEEKRAALETQATNLRLAVDKAVADLKRAQDQLKPVREELEDSNAKLQDMRRQLDDMGEALVAARAQWGREAILAGSSQVRYEPGTELRRGYIDAHQSLEQIEVSVRELEVVASKDVLAAGIQPGDNGLGVRLVMPSPPETPPNEWPAENDVIRLVARTILEGKADQYVVVVAVVFRSFLDDTRQVMVGLFIRPNTLVYPRGTVIVHRVIDGSRPRAEVFQRLWGLLGDLRAAAQEAGLMRDPKTGQYGQVPAESILQALDELLAHKQPLQVDAVAVGDVYVSSEEPFLVLLRVGQPAREHGGE